MNDETMQGSPNNCLVLPVLSGSMMPYVSPGGHICIECSAGRPRLGDILVFRESEKLVAHRLLCRMSLGRRRFLYQRGDAAGVGRWIEEKQVLGVVTKSTDAAGTVLYVRRWNQLAGHHSLFTHIFRAVLVWTKSVLRGLVANRSVRR
jgi:hypothetical protein